MEENSQEKVEIVEILQKTEEVVTPISESSQLEKNDSLDGDVEDEGDNSIENQNDENPEDFNSARSRSESECSERSGTGTEEDDADVVLEREEGDGQESTPNRKVDDDEDKRNPQYIPKRGTFYEHDDRTAQDEEEQQEQPEEPETVENEKIDKESAMRKKIYMEKEASKWSHDRFNDNEQAPKSRQELISIYGYDIRNEEGPPRARRRRRYGRGPNKYTRNWEDEEAYSKPTNVSVKPPVRKQRTKPGQEEFPPLNPHDQLSDSKSDRADSVASEDSKEAPRVMKAPLLKTFEKGKENREEQEHRHGNHEVHEEIEQFVNKGAPSKGGRGPQKRNEEQMKASAANNVRGVTKTRGFFKNGGRGSEVTRVRNQRNNLVPVDNEEYSDYILSQNFTNKTLNHPQSNIAKLEKDMANMTVQQKPGEVSTNAPSYTGSTISRGGKYGGGSTRQTSVPPRLQNEQRGSKRYSSLRQRSLPDTGAAPPFGQHPTYYPQEYAQQPSTQSQALLPHPTQTIHSQAPPTTVITVAAGSQPINSLPPTNGAPPLMQAPQFAAAYPQAPPPFIQAGVAPTAFIPQQPPPPQIINYAQAQFTQPQFTNFQHQQFTPVNQAPPTELYQPQGGITYYSPQNQQVVPRVPQKRVKAAIPIVPPPEHKEPRGRGRLNQSEQGSPVGGPPDPSEHYESSEGAEQNYQSDTSVGVQK